MATDFPTFIDVPDLDNPPPGAEAADAAFLNALTGAVNAVEDGKTALTVNGSPVSTYDIDTTPVTAADVGAATPGRAAALAMILGS